jgi:hypothetical protein
LAYGLVSGGITRLQVWIMHFVLWQANALPLRIGTFLHYARDRIFLRRVGSGYIFVHRLLQDYFAELDNDASSGRPAGSHLASSGQAIDSGNLYG